MTRIRRINVSQVEGGGADNSDTSEIRPSGETAFYLDNNNKLTLMMFDGVRTHIKSKVLSQGKLFGSDSDSGDGNGYDTIKLIPDSTLFDQGSNQYIIVDPTGGEPGHIHLRAGGIQDSSTADLYLGGELTFVRVSDTSGIVTVRTTNIGDPNITMNWSFQQDGNLYFPGIGNNRIGESEPGLVVSSSDAVVLQSNNNGESKELLFGIDGNLTVPGAIQNANSVVIKAGTAGSTVQFVGQIDNGFGDGPGSTLHVTSIISGTITDGMTIYGAGLPAEGWVLQFGTVMEPQGSGGTGNYYLPGANYLIGSQTFNNGDAPNSIWTFSTDGNLTLPQTAMDVSPAPVSLPGITYTDGTFQTTAWTGNVDYSNITNKPTIATESYVDTAIANLVGTAPAVLDTLNELSVALGNNANFATTITSELALKANITSLSNVAISGSYNDLLDKPILTTGYTGSQGITGYTGSASTIVGFTGSAGANGTIGIDGYTGSIGFTGSAGTNGFTGSAGTNGFTGSAGTNGFTGSVGTTGFTGSVGTTGFTGSAGTNGFTGSAGTNGFTGSVGTTGFTGSAGTTGFTGSAGTNGFTGSIGYTGSASSVVNVTDTNGLTTTYYLTFVENRTTDQIVRADTDLSYKTDTNTLSIGNLSVTGNIIGTVNGFNIGYLTIPQVAMATSITTALSDSGKHYYSTAATNLTLTVANNASQAFSIGTALNLINAGTGTITVAPGSGVTMYLAGNSTSSSRTVSSYGMATLLKVAADTWFISGTGVS